VPLSKRKSKDPLGESGQTEVIERLEEAEKPKKGPAEEEGLEERLKAAEAKAKENYDRLLRVTAELENYKKRMEREMNDFRKFANESLIKDVLPIVDNLERALEIPYANNEKAFHGMREGVQMTLKGLLGSLERFGVVPIESLDKPFDPNFHQAVMQEECEKRSANTVSKELQRGYMMRDRLLRPAMVAVSKKPDARPEKKSEGRPDEQKDEHKIDVTVQ
jgi:molecular chaperone GrpE